ncbi:hypothetical protein CANMA_000631 [Candida margitis]|uniref:uncharacterized protein n=1 Tax=Candida margitis TaxID=1775924 RepID=UPI0022270831|nr:uncharacterized protein CANMA_000631 [Candida margitis]KAI5970279.1 hypothetical protein CANMA_000631 [Candida margitis]
MQGSHHSNGLPRPYYMKPSSKKKNSPYNNLKEPIIFFNTPRRKLVGYVFMFLIIGTLMWWVSQDLKDKPDLEYEVVPADQHASSSSKHGLDNDNHNLDNMVKGVGSKADTEKDNIDLAGNLAAGSKGEKGLGVAEAPKGGIANEAPLVGNDADQIVGTGKGNGNKAQQNKLVGHPPSNGGSDGKSNERIVQQILEDTQ